MCEKEFRKFWCVNLYYWFHIFLGHSFPWWHSSNSTVPLLPLSDYVFVCVALPLPSPLFSSSFTLPHRWCQNLWKSRSAPDPLQNWAWDLCTATPIPATEGLSIRGWSLAFLEEDLCSRWIFANSEGMLLKTAMCWCIWGVQRFKLRFSKLLLK